ncbi:MAG: hypothetical protein H7145_08990 [Akkermansiaceae bacterium]|nr:hypothetical protein [Armatimonadota bacterium]
MMKRISLLALATFALTSTAFAQEAATTPPAVPAPARAEKVPMRTVKEVLKRIEEGAGTGVRIVADSTVLTEKVPLPAEATTPGNFEAQIAAVVDALPKGTAWAKLYLPAEDARSYKGDDLADYAIAQSKLFGRVGNAPAGSVEVMGKVLPAEKAQAVIDALNLKPVHLLTNPVAKAVSAGDSATWAKMTDADKEAFAKKEASKMIALGPQNLANQFGQQAAVMGQMFGMMSPEQRDQFRQSMMDTMRNGGGGMNMMFMGRGGGNRQNGQQRGGGRGDVQVTPVLPGQP